VPIYNMHLGVLKAGMISAVRLFCKALGAVSCLYFLSLSTPMLDILSALRRLKCPALLVEMMGLIYRFIFILFETAASMITAQNSVWGTQVYYRDTVPWVNLFLHFLSGHTSGRMIFTQLWKPGDMRANCLSRGAVPNSLDGLLRAGCGKHFDYCYCVIVKAVFWRITIMHENILEAKDLHYKYDDGTHALRV
jgi:hypothetical protein